MWALGGETFGQFQRFLLSLGSWAPGVFEERLVFVPGEGKMPPLTLETVHSQGLQDPR